MNIKKEIIYEPNKFAKSGFFTSFITLFLDLKNSFSLGYRLFIRDFKAKYKQQVLGFLWVLITPFIAVFTFAFLAKAKVLNIEGIAAPYIVYAFLGIIFWDFVNGFIISLSGVMNTSKDFMLQINFSREALLFSPVLIFLIDTGIKFILFAIICMIYGYGIKASNIIYFAAIIPLFLFSLGIGMFVCILAGVMKDIMSFVSVLLSFLLLVTPVMYPVPKSSFMKAVSLYNPFYYLVAVPRDLILFGHSPYFNTFLIMCGVSLMVFLTGWRFFKIAILRIVEKI